MKTGKVLWIFYLTVPGWINTIGMLAQDPIASPPLGITSIPELDPETLAKIKADLPAVRVKATFSPQKEIPVDLASTVFSSTSLFGTTKKPLAPKLLMVEFRSEDFPPNALNQLRDTSSNVEIERPSLFRPAPVQAFNLDAAISHHVPEMVATFGLTGAKGLVVAVFDEGGVRSTHTEFRSSEGTTRVSLKTSAALSQHSTHVAGTVGAGGASHEAQGMAPRCSILSYDWENDLTNLDQVAANVTVSNHSYGPSTGWSYWKRRGIWLWWGNTEHSPEEDSNYGKYTQQCAAMDDLLARHPNLVAVIAAGNERGRLVSPPQQPVNHFVLAGTEWTHSQEVRKANAWDQGGLDTMSGMANAKNAITISAINDVTGAGIVETTNFSSWGPSDDLRIKPDLCANGDRLYSTSIAGDDAYEFLSGTSMASPVAAGICALTAEMVQSRLQRRALATEIKGILIHTSQDAGVAGPDAVYGWGTINAFAAGKFIEDTTQGESTIALESVSQGESKSHTLTGAGSPARITVVWADPAGAPNTGGLDDPAKSLVCDLDIMLTSEGGETLYPYSIGGNGLLPATATGKNSADNVEVIDVPGEPTKWTLTVKGTKVPAGLAQSYSLLISGLKRTP